MHQFSFSVHPTHRKLTANLRKHPPPPLLASSSLSSGLQIRPLRNLYGKTSKHRQPTGFYGDVTSLTVDHFRQKDAQTFIHL